MAIIRSEPGPSTPPSAQARARELKEQASDIASFADALTDEDRQVFFSGHRLSVSERDRRVDCLSLQDRRQGGYRFSDEPVDLPEAHQSMLREAWDALPRPAFVVLGILAALWAIVDPLQLELWVDTMGQGANLLYNGPRGLALSAPNHASAAQNLEVFSGLVTAEATQGWLSGPTPLPRFPFQITHPCSLAPKADTFRLIEDWSARLGQLPSTNEQIDETKDKYDRFDDVVTLFILRMRQHGSVWFAKADFKAAYRQIHVRALDLSLGGIFVLGLGHYFRTRVSYGGKPSGHLWERIVLCFLALLAANKGLRGIFHWVDDLFLLCRSRGEAVSALEAIVWVARVYGFKLSFPKLEFGLALEFTGVLFDSVSYSLSVIPSKREKARSMLESLLASPAWTRKDFERLCGHLTHFGRIIRPLRQFGSRAIRRMNSSFPSGRQLPVDPGRLRDDVLMFLLILDTWTGSMALHVFDPVAQIDASAIVIEMDSSPLWGFGAFCVSSGDFVLSAFSPAQMGGAARTKSYSSSLLETIPLPLVLSSFGALLRGKVVVLRGDSMNMFQNLRSRSSPTCELTQQIMRMVTALEVQLGCRLVGRHIGRAYNFVADFLSHGDVDGARRSAASRGLTLSPRPRQMCTALIRPLDRLCGLYPQ
jgi:hypothetical protein